MRLGAGLRLALTTLTILPLPTGPVDRAAGRAAMVLAPLVGAVLGAGAAGLLAGLRGAGAGPLLAAALTLGALALLTRGLHLDGLADTADGLGSAASRERALAIMRSPEVGPFGVATLVLVLLGQAAAVAQLAAEHRWLAVGVGAAAGRLAITWSCRREVPPARSDGLGALVAGSVPVAVALLVTAPVAVGGAFAVRHSPWLGVVAVALAAAVGVGLSWHVSRRLGGITGDTLGACCELGTLLAWTLLAL